MAKQPERNRSVKADGDAIKRLRKSKGFAVEDLSRISDISERTIRSAENGGSVHVRTIKALANVFLVSCDDLIQGSNLPWPRQNSDAWHDFTQFLEAAGAGITYHRSDIDRLLISFTRAANHTLSYCTRITAGEERSRDAELRLSDLWLLVVDPLLRLGNYEIKRKIVLKSRYWACIDYWSDEDIQNAGIKLEPLTKEAEAILNKLMDKE